MKLLKCYVENFGNLQNYEHEFEDGLNIIKENNGFGKTTFATFIKSMFYGLEDRKNLKIERSERKKYFPWQGGNYGGNIEFEIEGRKYKIERFFGKKEADDTFKLYDLSTNLESKEYTEKIGEEIFKLNNLAYERSTYIPQGQIQIEMEDTISAKLGNVLENESDINTSEKALENLKEAKKIYLKEKGKSGLIDEKKDQLNKLKRELENCQTDSENLKIKEEKLRQINEQIKKQNEIYENEQKDLTKKIENERKLAKLETYKKILDKYSNFEEKTNNIKQIFKDKIPDENNLKEVMNKNIELENVKNELNKNSFQISEIEKLNELKTKFENEYISVEEIDNAIKECYSIPEIEKEIEINKSKQNQIENENKKSKKMSFIIKCIGVIVAIIGMVLCIANIQKTFGLIGIIVGIIIFIVSFIFSNGKKNNKNYKTEIEKMENEKEKVEDHISKILQFNKKNNDFSLLNNQEKLIILDNLKTELNLYNNLTNKKNENEQYVNNLKLKKDKLNGEISNFLNYYFDDINNSYTELIQDLSLKRNEYKSFSDQLEISKKEKEQFEEENNIDELKNIEVVQDISEQDVKSRILELRKNTEQLIDEKNQIKNQIEVLENKIDDNDFLEEEIEKLESEIEDLNNKYKIINITEQLLKTAKERFSSKYLQDMVSEYKNYMKIIDNNDLSTNVDTNLDVTVDIKGSQKNVKFFSSGYKDLIYICMRLGLIKTLFRNEKPFVILDDPFVNLDDEKTKKAINVINEMAKQYQIIYFVCNSSRAQGK